MKKRRFAAIALACALALCAFPARADEATEALYKALEAANVYAELYARYGHVVARESLYVNGTEQTVLTAMGAEDGEAYFYEEASVLGTRTRSITRGETLWNFSDGWYARREAETSAMARMWNQGTFLALSPKVEVCVSQTSEGGVCRMTTRVAAQFALDEDNLWQLPDDTPIYYDYEYREDDLFISDFTTYLLGEDGERTLLMTLSVRVDEPFEPPTFFETALSRVTVEALERSNTPEALLRWGESFCWAGRRANLENGSMEEYVAFWANVRGFHRAGGRDATENEEGELVYDDGWAEVQPGVRLRFGEEIVGEISWDEGEAASLGAPIEGWTVLSVGLHAEDGVAQLVASAPAEAAANSFGLKGSLLGFSSALIYLNVDAKSLKEANGEASLPLLSRALLLVSDTGAHLAAQETYDEAMEADAYLSKKAQEAFARGANQRLICFVFDPGTENERTVNRFLPIGTSLSVRLPNGYKLCADAKGEQVFSAFGHKKNEPAVTLTGEDAKRKTFYLLPESDG